jgi:hypothetical protein
VTSADEGKLPASSIGAGAKRVALSLSGLAGGHSGNDIGFKRMNAMKALTAGRRNRSGESRPSRVRARVADTIRAA